METRLNAFLATRDAHQPVQDDGKHAYSADLFLPVSSTTPVAVAMYGLTTCRDKMSFGSAQPAE